MRKLMIIPVEFKGFGPSTFPLQAAKYRHMTSWAALVWAAITSGKKGPLYWMPHPFHSFAEASSRAFAIYAYLRQDLGSFTKSKLYDDMDPTEKGAASYFLGMSLTKLLAEDFFDTPWLFHLSNATQALSYKQGKSRPDLLGRTYHSGRWIVLESKGRSNGFDAAALAKAKSQARMVSTVNGAVPLCAIGVQAFFSPMLEAIAIDPPPAEEAMPLEVDMASALNAYYSIRFSLRRTGRPVTLNNNEYFVREIPDTGVTIGLPTSIVFDDIIREVPRARGQMEYKIFSEQGQERIFRDGFYISLDSRWSETEMEKELSDRTSW